MTAVAGFDRDSDSSSLRPRAEDPRAGAASGGGAAAESDGLIVTGARADGTEGEARSRAEEARASSSTPSEDDLLDVLYEVLAQGVPPRSSLSREVVERFLHQHAREKKPIGEMLAFFERHGLPVDAGEYGADRELRALASGLQRERGSLVAGFGPSHELVQPTAPTTEPPPAPAALVVPPTDTGSFGAVTPDFGRAPDAAQPRAVSSAPLEDESTGRRLQLQTTTGAAPTPPSKLRWLALVAAVLALALLGSVFVVNQQRAAELEQRLDQARMQQRSTDDALTKLEQRAETLQGALEQSEQEHRQEATRLQTTLEAEKQQRATEEMAVEKMLGPRYLKLRQKLTTEAAQTVPAIVPTGNK